MSKIKIENLDLIFGRRKEQAKELIKQGKSKEEILDKTGCTVAVNDANISINEGEIFVIMGLSGSGKSTLLRCVNRLIEPTSGTVTIEGTDVTKATDKELRAMRRTDISMVFQHFGLLPHRTVSSNVAFGLEIQGVDEKERKEKAYNTIKVVGLEGYEEMMTGELSGGMQQRVGLARALCTDPEILLMDEAFSALDPLIRNQMQDELIDLQKKVKKTILFITHDLDEALKLGDRIAIMKDGRIVQIGTPEDILVDPADDYVKAFVENVDRSTIVTASAIMFDKPTKVNIDKHGPTYTLKTMRDKGLNILPVVDNDDVFKGFVKDTDIAVLKKRDARDIKSAVITEAPMVAPDTPVADLLPLYLDYSLPIAVVNGGKKLRGIVIHASVISEMIGIEPEDIKQMKEDVAL